MKDKPDDLLAALEGRRWQSGAEVARRLGVSRAAVWKRIERLRSQGYGIEAVAGRGYRLVRDSDLLLPDAIRKHLRAKLLRGEIVHRTTIDSTNRLAAEQARGGAVEGTIVVAEQQTAGRGRLGRTWVSPASVNLYMSVVLRPRIPPLEVPRLTLVAGLAVAEAIRDSGTFQPRIKWPNDVLLDGRKVAGILTELEAEADRVRFVIVGIGVNLNATRTDFPPDLKTKATSLLLAGGAPVDRAAFTGRLLTRLDAAYAAFLSGGFAALRHRYEELHGLVGLAVTIDGTPPLAGTVRGVDDGGALLVESGGALQRVVSGEVTLRQAYRKLRRGPV
ncbi:biotin--[acetyl-CoA-carboxylase] ligase [Candidatus Binatia bacterium]|nr:biotin--[acetyl-CoA-carboxylase] ligase [Candidatus Binatia bacterium]